MIHAHHRKRRAQGGRDDPVNLIGLPDVIHEWVHANPEKAYECGLLVKSHDDPAEIQVIIPEEALKVARKPRAKSEPEAKRQRATVQVRVPKDSQEDGAGILDDLINLCREGLAEDMGWQEDVPAYYVLVAVLHDWLTGS